MQLDIRIQPLSQNVLGKALEIHGQQIQEINALSVIPGRLQDSKLSI